MTDRRIGDPGLSAAEGGVILAALRRYQRHQEQKRRALLRKFGPGANPSSADRTWALADSAARKIEREVDG